MLTRSDDVVMILDANITFAAVSTITATWTLTHNNRPFGDNMNTDDADIRHQYELEVNFPRRCLFNSRKLEEREN